MTPKSNFFKKWILFSLGAWAIFQPLSIAGANIAIALILCGLLGQATTLKKNFYGSRDPLEKPLWIYFFVGILAGLWNGGFKQSLGPVAKDGQMILDLYVFLAAFAVEGSSATLGFWALGFSLTALLGLAQFSLWRWDLSQAQAFNALIAPSHFWSAIYASNRAHGAIHPVSFGDIMVLAALGTLAWRAHQRKTGQGPGIVSSLVGLTMILALALSGTRGAWIGFMAGTVLLVVLEFKFILPEALIAAALIATQFFFSPRFAGAVQALNPKESSFKDHLSLLKTAWRMFLDHPLFGVGPGHFSDFFGRYHSLPFEGQPSWGNAHDLYLHQLAERGLVGFAALTLVLATMALQSWKNYRRDRSFLSLWFLCWIFAFLVMNVSETAFQVGMVWMPTLALYCWMSQSHSSKSKQASPHRLSGNS